MKNKKLTVFLANMGIIIVSETTMAAGEFEENEIVSPKKGVSVVLTDENKVVLKKKKIFEESKAHHNKYKCKNNNGPLNHCCVNATCTPN